MNNHTNTDLQKIFKDNWERFKSSENNFDLRAQFEALYDCFENIGQLTTRENGSRMIKKLKEDSEVNILKTVFMYLYEKPNRNGALLFYLKKLRALQPIYNNTREGKIVLTKELPFETFLDALYAIRCNIRHGIKEYTVRSEDILFATVGILRILLQETYNKIFEKELLVIKERERMSLDKVRKNKDNLNTFKSILSFLAFLLFIPFISFMLHLFRSNDEAVVIVVDCSKEQYLDVCDPPIQQDDSEQYKLYRGR